MFSKLLSLVFLFVSALSSPALAISGECGNEAVAANNAILQINQEEPNLSPEDGLKYAKDPKTGMELYTFRNFVSEGYRSTLVTARLDEVDGISKCVVYQVNY
jgi:hypothetical protein